jgi:mannose-1-phosphate guanylyltransferase/phosphomannomutase
MNNNIRAMVMAAGAGTRLRPLTFTVPKPMVPVANRPVLEYTLENLRRHGIVDVVLNLHSYPQLIRDHFKDGSSWGMNISYSYEPALLGTAGGVKKMESFLNKGTFLVMSGDGLTDVNLTELLHFHKQRGSKATMGLKPVEARFDYGVTLTDRRGKITRFFEKPKWSDVFSNQVNTGIYVFEPEIFTQIPKGKMYDFGHELWPKLLQKRWPIFGFPVKDYWCDVGNLAEYRRGQQDLLDGHVRFHLPGRVLRPGVRIDDGTLLSKGVKLESPVLIGRDGRIGAGTFIGGHTVIGHRARIGKKVILRNCILWDDVKVADHVTLDNCIIGSKAQVTESISVYEGALMDVSR